MMPYGAGRRYGGQDVDQLVDSIYRVPVYCRGVGGLREGLPWP